MSLIDFCCFCMSTHHFKKCMRELSRFSNQKCLITALKLSLKHRFKQFKETQEMVVENLLFSNSVEKGDSQLLSLI